MSSRQMVHGDKIADDAAGGGAVVSPMHVSTKKEGASLTDEVQEVTFCNGI